MDAHEKKETHRARTGVEKENGFDPEVQQYSLRPNEGGTGKGTLPKEGHLLVGAMYR